MSILQIPQGGVDESFKQTWHKPHDQLSFFFLQLYRCEILPSVITRQSQPTSQSNPPTLYFLNPKNQAWTPHPIIKNKIQMLGSKNPLNLQQPKLIFRAFFQAFFVMWGQPAICWFQLFMKSIPSRNMHWWWCAHLSLIWMDDGVHNTWACESMGCRICSGTDPGRTHYGSSRLY